MHRIILLYGRTILYYYLMFFLYAIGVMPVIYNPQNEMLPFHKTKCSETQNEASSL